MKKALLLLLTVALCAGNFTSAKAEKYPFTDVSAGGGFYDAICYVYENGLMSGDGSGRFYPDRTLSRAELIEIIYNMEGRPPIDAASTSFTDVPVDSWFSDAVKWAKSSSVIYGTPEGTFLPFGDVDIEQLAVVLMRYAGADQAPGVVPVPEGASDWAKEALRWATGIGIRPERTPGELVARGRAAQLLKLFCERAGDITAIGCTVWPMTDLPVYSTPEGVEEAGVASASGSFSVLGEENGKFLIDNGGVAGYINSADCLIDLADYLGDMCAYDIKNCYRAIYNVNGYGIPGVTGTVIPGYEDAAVKSSAGAPTRFAIPLLYPTAQKVAGAAKKAQEMGYKLKIYDAFRPQIASEYLYKTTELVLNKKLPSLPYIEMTDEQWREYMENIPDSDGMRNSFYFEMTNGRYDLGTFLAQNISAHNLGIAIDLTLERIADGEELHMQTGMHDLSWRSFRRENNQNADLLSYIMESSGLTPLFSEWWHFQDDELREMKQNMIPRENGVTIT